MMKASWIFLIFMCCAGPVLGTQADSLSLAPEQPDTLFSKANAAFQDGNFELAARLYSQLVDAGYQSAALYYNLGNACFRNHRLADAILNYERASLLDPRDPDIRFNLELARTYVKDKIDVLPQPFYLRWHRALVRLLPPDAWAWISLVCFALAFMFFSVYLYFHSFLVRRTGFWVAVFLFFVSVSSFVFAREHHSLVTGQHTAVIYDPSVTVKSTPDQSGTDLFVLHEGTKVSLGDELGDWREIRISDGNKGWVPRASIRTI